MFSQSLVHLSALSRDRVDFPPPVSVLRKYAATLKQMFCTYLATESPEEEK